MATCLNMQLGSYRWLLHSVVLVLSVIIVVESADDNIDADDMTVDALQTMIDEIGKKGVQNIEKVTPIYREDLSHDQVASYEVLHNENYYIVSSGKETGEPGLVTHGDRPEPSLLAMQAAESRGAVCVKYYLMTTVGDVMCTDKSGTFVGTSMPDSVLLGDEKVNFQGNVASQKLNYIADVSTLDKFIKSKSVQQADMWHQRAKRRAVKNEEGSFVAKAIIPGTVQTIATGQISNLHEVRVRYIPTSDIERKEADIEDQKKLCEVIRGCDPSTATDKYALLPSKKITLRNAVIDLELLPETGERYKNSEFVFALDIVGVKSIVTSHHYGVMYEAMKQSRELEKKDWSSQTFHVIDRHDLFPAYVRAHTSLVCLTGRVPVAWAMIFGYYDRRSHYSRFYSRSKNLYKSGSDGTYGDSREKAPSDNDVRMDGYIKYLSKVVRNTCHLTASVNRQLNDAKRVSSFFRKRQSRNPKVIDSEKNSWKFVRDRLLEKWPVLFFTSLGTYASSYPLVATKMRHAHGLVRECKDGVCENWREADENWVFVHFGWGRYFTGRPNGNRWMHITDAKESVQYAVAAIYEVKSV